MKPHTAIPLAIADSYIMMRKGITSVITGSNQFIVVLEAASGTALLQQLQQAKELPHICILDMDMPEMEAFNTLIELRTKWPDIKVLAYSMYSDPIVIQKLVHEGAAGFLQKKSTAAELLQALLSIHTNGFQDAPGFSSYLLAAMQQPWQPLAFTEKEKQLLKHIGTDMSYAEIARIMGTTARSVQGYRDRLFTKLHVNSRAALISYAIKFGIVSIS